jgi:hypothetical protein
VTPIQGYAFRGICNTDLHLPHRWAATKANPHNGFGGSIDVTFAPNTAPRPVNCYPRRKLNSVGGPPRATGIGLGTDVDVTSM